LAGPLSSNPLGIIRWVSRMYVLKFIRGQGGDTGNGDAVAVEFRLLCSGELYNSAVLTTDWRKSIATRLLVTKPFELIVSSHPFDEYPQELAMRFAVSIVTETKASGVAMFYPDEEIARDLAAMLTLLLRRLITVCAKVREVRPREYPEEPSFPRDYPLGFVGSSTPVSWEMKPSVVVYGRDGIQEITHYNPPPLGVDPAQLTKRLETWASASWSEALLRSARLYSVALQEIERNPGMSYQLLVSCVEAIAGEVLRDYAPTRSNMLEAKKSVLELALTMGLNQESAEALALEATSGMSWARRKFSRFLLDNAGDEIWMEDDLFHPPDTLLPNRDDFEGVLKSIYSARGGATHSGRPFPDSAGIGTGPTVRSSVMIDIDFSSPSLPIPPVVWFERVVNSALNHFIDSATVSGNALL